MFVATRKRLPDAPELATQHRVNTTDRNSQETSFAEEAARFDAADPLAPLRAEFLRPVAADGRPILHFAGHSLGLQPRLAREATPLIFMGKRPGLDAALPLRLARLFRQVGAVGVHTHHIGPLLYAGLAARTIRNLRCVHTEHDAWHLQNAKRRRLARLALRLAAPVLTADAPHVADAVQAALAAGMVRLRPVVMTALAMIIGMLPMSLGFGEGGEQNAPLGRAVIGGLVMATIATLFFVPVVFSLLHRRAPAPAKAPSDFAPAAGGITPAAAGA